MNNNTNKYYNIGNGNTGGRNTGNRNTGSYNVGNSNTGYYNVGSGNVGDYNTGSYNTGDYNTGSGNVGDYNTGSGNAGDYNSCNFTNGFFNTIEQEIYIFNKKTNLKKTDVDLHLPPIKLTEWIFPSEMTIQEKKDNPSWETCDGYLKKRTFKEAFQLFWFEAEQSEKEMFLNLPNFDWDIFTKITGVTEEPIKMTLAEIEAKLGIKNLKII